MKSRYPIIDYVKALALIAVLCSCSQKEKPDPSPAKPGDAAVGPAAVSSGDATASPDATASRAVAPAAPVTARTEPEKTNITADGGNPTADALMNDLSSKELARLHTATEALVGRGALAVPALAIRLASEPDLAIRLKICEVLARLRGNAAAGLPALEAVVVSDRGPAREIAARAMNWILCDQPGGQAPAASPDWKRIASALLADLSAPDPKVRDGAARSVAFLAPCLDAANREPLIPVLIALTEDSTVEQHLATYAFIPATSSRPVAEAATWALEQFGLDEPRIAACLQVFYGKPFFAGLDLSRPELKDISASVAAGDYGTALRLYKRMFLERLAKLEIGEPWNWGRAGDVKLLLSNHLKAAQYSAKTGATRYVGAPGAMDWFIDEPQNNCWPEFSHRMTWTGFLMRSSEQGGFATTGNPECLRLWLGAFSDFDSNIRHQFAIAKEQYSGIGIGNVWWGHDGGIFGWLLQQAFRLEARINGLALAARTQPQVTDAVLSEIVLAKFLMATTKDMDYIVPWLTNRNVVAETRVPANQLMHGVNAVSKGRIALADFKQANGWSAGITTYIDMMPMYPDGTELEQSFNYNGGVIDFAKKFQEIFPANENVERMKRMGVYAMRFLACIARPNDGATPGEAKIHKRVSMPAGYDDQLTRLITSRLDENSGAQQKQGVQPPGREVDTPATSVASGLPSVPVFDSVAFPYSGYYILRNGWTRDAIHLYLKGGRKGTGHSAATSNQIQLTAWGRILLTRGGSGLYGAGPFPGYDEYINSSFSYNTITVDGETQANPGMPMQKAPVACRWLASPAFDFAEGWHEAGYDGVADPVVHARQVIFLKKAGIFLVRDRMQAAQEHTYAQTWCLAKDFTPAQVKCDGAAQAVRTQDPNGPNLEILHVGGATVTYSTSHGEKTPVVRGWRDKEFPAVDVVASWRGAETHLLTLLCPSGPQGTPIASVERNLIRDASTFAIHLKDGSRIEGSSARGGATTLSAGGWTATSELLLAHLQSDGTAQVLALGCKELKRDGRIQQLPPDAVFSAKGGNIGEIREIRVPTGFSWHEDGERSYPLYDRENTWSTGLDRR
jgi:hypothetical protein